MATCRRCGAVIKFIKMSSGKWNPCDPEKRTIIKGEGNEVLVTENGEVITGKFASLEEGANGEGYISHFATCKYADEFRRK